MTFSQRAVEAGKAAMEEKRAELQHLPLARVYAELADAALNAALAVDGVALVPKEPTGAILDALAEECRFTWGVNVKDSKPCPLNFKSEWRERMRPLYRSMLSAASDGEERK